MKTALVLFFVLLALVVLSRSNETAAHDDRSEYCAMVKNGAWPDFHHTYKDECGGKNPPKFVAH